MTISADNNSETSIDVLESKAGKSWKQLAAARNKTDEVKKQIFHDVIEEGKLVPADAALVVFGSLARKEWTSGSDLDWTLLVDGQASPDHFKLTNQLKVRLDSLFPRPGNTETFGNITFSHDLVHNIGGDEDTNKNTTRRILLLLESTSLGPDTNVHRRVVQTVLSRYIQQENKHLDKAGKSFKVPRFLLNDIVRYWRTMAVDFAKKEREGGKKWGLRNAKLQVSRKLIFVSGLLSCFGCKLNLSVDHEDQQKDSQEIKLLGYLKKTVECTPLEVLADAVLKLGISKTIATELFDCYDEFLKMLDDKDKRARLEAVTPDMSQTDDVFRAASAIGKRYADALESMFFDNEALKPLTRRYGLF